MAYWGSDSPGRGYSYREISYTEPLRRATYSRPGTYGTYIYPVEKAWYHTADLSACYCNCCPHDRRCYPKPHHLPAEKSRGRGYDSLDRPSTPKRSRDRPGGGFAPSGWRSRDPGPTKEGRIYINVADKTRGPLRYRHGRDFQLSISPRCSVRDVASFLAPAGEASKVMVRWRDGVLEPLDDLVSLDDVVRDGRELVIKQRKSVHWG